MIIEKKAKKTIDEILEKLNDVEVRNIIELCDDGDIESDEITTLTNYVDDCVNNNNDSSNYYIYTFNHTPNYYDVLTNYYNYNAIRLLCEKIYKDVKESTNNTSYVKSINNIASKEILLSILSNVKGIRDNQDFSILIGKYIDTLAFMINDDDNVVNALKSSIIEQLKDTSKKYIVSVSNTPLSQLTSSYSKNYNSCYNLKYGEYRSSNVFLMRDNRSYIVKIYDYNDNNLSMISDDTLKVSDDVISRFNYCIDDNNVVIAKIYGDRSFIANDNSKFINFATKIININNDVDVTLTTNYNVINYCDEFIGYQDYRCNYVASSDKCCIDNIGSNDNVDIEWDINDSDMIIHNKIRYCACCGCEIYNDDDCCYCEDIDDYCCNDCIWYDDNRNEYYSNNTPHIATPNGCCYRLDDCDVYD